MTLPPPFRLLLVLALLWGAARPHVEAAASPGGGPAAPATLGAPPPDPASPPVHDEATCPFCQGLSHQLYLASCLHPAPFRPQAERRYLPTGNEPPPGLVGARPVSSRAPPASQSA